MLEMTYSWSEWRIEERRRGKRDGVIEGKIIGQVEIWKMFLKKVNDSSIIRAHQ